MIYRSWGHLHPVIIRGNADNFTIERLEELLKNIGTDGLEITFEQNYVLPRRMIQWLIEKIEKKNIPIMINVREEKLHRYLFSLGIKANRLYKECNHHRIEAVVIGGSAGSIDTIKQMVASLKVEGLSIFIVQHIGKDDHKLFKSVLQTITQREVLYPENSQKVEKGKIYLVPPDFHLRIKAGYIYLDQDEKINYARPSISATFSSFAQEYGSNGLCIFTCGYGHDGVDALDTLHRLNTSVIVQQPEECDARTIPQSAVDTGKVSLILRLDVINSLLSLLSSDAIREGWEESFFDLMEMLYGYSFRHYNRQSIQRRIQRELESCEYADTTMLAHTVLLEKTAFENFFFTVSINVTEFFRKPSSLLPLREVLIRDFSDMPHFKCWIAGCSSGEEAYSMAMLFSDAGCLERSLIYATDINKMIIQIAQNGYYSEEEIAMSLPAASQVLRRSSFESFFEKEGSMISVIAPLREKVFFFEHNLVTDGSFNEFMLISCKNVLIYFDEILQDRVMGLFYDSLQMGGFLQLGTSEMLPQRWRNRFAAIDIAAKIYQKVR